MDGYFSRFGGLWIDQRDAAAVDKRTAAIPDDGLRQAIAAFTADGYVVLRGAVDPAAIDAYLREYEAAAATPGALLISTPGHARPTEPFDNALTQLPGTKVLDTGALLPAAPRLCFAPRVGDFLTTVFEEPALAFQTLHFEMGSVQGMHQDTAYVVVADDPMKLVASWIALEDVEPGTGELIYYVGGHRLPEHVYSDAHKHFNIERDGEDQHTTHYRLLHAEAERRGLELGRFLARKGDVLLWHADLPHGGSKVTQQRTRRSLVTHYCPLSLTPHYFGAIDPAWRRKVDVPGGHAVSSYYYDPATFFRPAPALLVQDLYQALLKRPPTGREQEAAVSALAAGADFAAIFRSVHDSPEHAALSAIPVRFPPGHPRSPIVDPHALAPHLDRAYAIAPEDLAGIDIDLAAMAEFWSDHAPTLRATPFPAAPSPARRYHHGPGQYPYGDAVVLRLMMHFLRPRRIVQISPAPSACACVLDSAQEFALAPLSLTCIDPQPERLRKVLKDASADIVAARVETVDPALFATLEQDDVLMVDSTHILKTASDVCHILFEILPRLRPGVVVALHSCQYPFEYPAPWLQEQNFSWNEIYAFRAFFAFNSRFRIVFWNSLFARHAPDDVKPVLPAFIARPGSSLWVVVQ